MKDSKSTYEDLEKEIIKLREANEYLSHTNDKTQVSLNSTIESFSETMIVGFDKQYRFLFFNSAYEKATLDAYGRVVSVGMNMFDGIKREDDRKTLKENYERTLLGENFTIYRELGDLQRTYLEINYSPIIDNGDIVGATIIFENITKQKEAEIEIARAQEVAEEHEKALQKAHDKLELRVNERTVELSEVNDQLNWEIEERKKAEDVLYQREQEFRTLVENAPDIIFRFDKALKHTYVNTAIEKATGGSKQDFIGKDHRELGMPEDLVSFFQGKIREAFETGKEIEFSFVFPTPTGERHYESRYVPEFSKEGTVEHVMGVSRDITNQKLVEEALKESEEDLRESNNTKDKFFSIIAHDLKSPFVSLVGFSNMLNEEFDNFDTEKKKEFISIINRQSQSTFKLLENLLFWSNSQRGVLDFNSEKINLFLLSEETCELLNQSAINKSIKLSNRLPENILVEADKDMLSSVIRNLLSNAIKFTLKGGEVIITAENKQQHTEIVINDNGVGIAKEFQSKLFDISESTSTKGTENETGTGLGLILCKEFVEKHGGLIWVESELGKGSSFHFTIPFEPVNSELT